MLCFRGAGGFGLQQLLELALVLLFLLLQLLDLLLHHEHSCLKHRDLVGVLAPELAAYRGRLGKVLSALAFSTFFQHVQSGGLVGLL